MTGVIRKDKGAKAGWEEDDEMRQHQGIRYSSGIVDRQPSGQRATS